MKKISPDDLRALTDKKAEPARRAQALSRLAHWERGKYDQLESTIASLLDEDNPMVRGAAIKTLVSGWQREKYLGKAIDILLKPKDEWWVARGDAAFALGQYARFAGRERDRIIRVLLQGLKTDPEWPVQRACYEQLLELVAPDRDPPESEEFNRDTDVDWNLLAPYLPQ